TSGLDSSSTLEVLQLLRSLADNGTTIVMTIHQPRQEAFNLLDNLILLAKGGKLAYYGPANATKYFERLTKRTKPNATNTADYIMDQLENVAIKKSPSDWQKAYLESDEYKLFVTRRLLQEKIQTKRQRARKRSILLQFIYLFHRYSKRKINDSYALLIQLVQAPIIAGLLAILFHNEAKRLVETEIIPIYEKIPVLLNALQLQNGIHPTLFLTCAAAFWFGCSNVAREIVGQIPIIKRESRSGLRVYSYVLAVYLFQLLILLLQTLIMTVFIWLFVGLHSPFLYGWAILLLTAAAGTSLGLAVSSISRTEVMAISLMPILLFPQLLLGGYVKLYGRLKNTGWQNYLADAMPIRWSFDALITKEYEGIIAANAHLRGLEIIIGFSGDTITYSLVYLSLFNVVMLHLCILFLWLRSR
ncbi:MAG: ABC transporter permease, partial [Myxococcota bacterium]|nr:ABC transporter permease [Myxococcota bacterium]